MYRSKGQLLNRDEQAGAGPGPRRALQAAAGSIELFNSQCALLADGEFTSNAVGEPEPGGGDAGDNTKLVLARWNDNVVEVRAVSGSGTGWPLH